MNNKYFEIIYHLDKENYIKWWLLKHYRSFINRIIALKQITPLTLNGTILHKLFKIIIYGKTEQDGTPTPETPVEIKNVEGSIEFKVENKNKFKNPSNPTSISASTSVSYNNNILTLSSSARNSIPYATYLIDENLVEGDIIRLRTVIKNSNGQIRISVYNGTSWQSAGSIIYSDGTSVSSLVYTVPAGITGIRYYIYANNVIPTEDVSSSYENIIVTKNNEDMSYQPYAEQTQIFTFEEGQYLAEGGYLADDGIYNIKKKITLTGSEEDWRTAAIGSSRNAFELSLSDIVSYTNGDITPNLVSNKFTKVSYNGTWKPANISRWINRKSIVLIVSPDMDLSAFQTWLSTLYANGTPVKIEYELADPQPTPYTPTQQAQWNAIKNMYTYKDQTNIDVLANLDGIEIDIGYYGTSVISQETLEELSNGRGD